MFCHACLLDKRNAQICIIPRFIKSIFNIDQKRNPEVKSQTENWRPIFYNWPTFCQHEGVTLLLMFYG